MSHMRVWGLRVRPERRSEFETYYGVEGAWTALFRVGHGFVGTELWRDEGDEDFYVVVDRWQSREDFERFLERERDAYDSLDESGSELTVADWFIGAFDDSADIAAAR